MIKKRILLTIISLFIITSSTQVNAQVSRSDYCASLGYSKIHKVGWTEWLGSANPRARNAEQNDFWFKNYLDLGGDNEELDNMHKVPNPLDNSEEVFRVTQRKGKNYGVASRMRSLFKTDTNEVCMAYKIYYPTDFEFGDTERKGNASYSKKGSKILGLVGTDQNHNFDKNYGCHSWEMMNAFTYRLQLDWFGRIDNYVFYRDDGGCGKRISTDYIMPKGKWVQIEQLASIGSTETSGRFELWIDGEKISEGSGYDFGGTRDAYIGGIMQNIFFGGDGVDTASRKDEFTYLKDIELHFGEKGTNAVDVEIVSTRQRVYDVMQNFNEAHIKFLDGKLDLPNPLPLKLEDIELADASSQPANMDIFPSGGDGNIDNQDITSFNQLFSSGQSLLDFDRDGNVTIYDLSLLIYNVIKG